MQIAIIGTGRMAQRLGLGWDAVGHTLIFGSRAPSQREFLTKKIRTALLTDPATAVASARTVVLCLPYPEVAPFARRHATQLQNKLVIDISNPFDHLSDNRLAGAEITAQAIGPGARVVAAFKSNFWETLTEPVEPSSGLVRNVYLAGDSVDDKQIVALLVEDLGFRPVDCGPLHNARLLDGMVPLLIELDRRYSGGQHKAAWHLLG